MSQSRGKQFEQIIREAFEKVPNTTVTRLPDQTNGFSGGCNICDFIVYHYPYQYFIECKTIHGNTLPFSNITKNQRTGMYKECWKHGVRAGVIVWYVDKDVTKWIPIQIIEDLRGLGYKSYRFDKHNSGWKGEIHTVEIPGKKKRVFFDYDMESFFNKVNRKDAWK